MRRLGFVYHVRIEDLDFVVEIFGHQAFDISCVLSPLTYIEFVSLHSLRWRIVDIVVLLVVLVPVVAGVDSVVVARFARPVLVRPAIGLLLQLDLLRRGSLLATGLALVSLLVPAQLFFADFDLFAGLLLEFLLVVGPH